MSLQPHEERVVAERDELVIKLHRLIAFIGGGGAFADLDIADQNLLRRQESIMLEYIDLLNERIFRFAQKSN